MSPPTTPRSPIVRRRDRLRRARPYLSRASWALLDQGLSTATNFALVILVARRTDPAGFGLFTLALAVFTLVQGTARAGVGESLLVLTGAAAPDDIRKATVAAVPIIFAIAGASVLVTSPAWVGNESALPIAGAFAVTGGGLLLADLMRFSYFAMRRPDLAAALDGLWAALMAGGIVAWHPSDAASTVLIWGSAGAVAGVIPFLAWRRPPRLAAARRWWASARTLAVRFGSEFLAGAGAGHTALLLVGALASVPAAGAVRGAMLLFGPVNLAFQALTPQAIVEGLDVGRRRGSFHRRLATAVSLSFLLGVVVWTLVLMKLPDGLGQSVLGSNWTAARQVVPAYAGFAVAGAIIAGPFVGLRILGAASRSFRARVISAAGTVTGAAIGAYLGGAVGASAGMAVGALLGASVWWCALLAGSPTPTPGFPAGMGTQQPRPVDLP